MAKTLFGAIVVDMRNKLGGHVFSKNKGGSFVRRKVSPSQPRTSYQRTIRGIVTELSRAWGGVLDDDARGAWTAFAAGHPVRDQFGQNVYLTGEQMYVRLNNVILFHGGTRIDAPPDSLAVTAITSFTLSANHTGPLLTLADVLPATLETNEKYVVWATPLVGPGRNAIQSKLAHLKDYAALTGGDLEVGADWVLKYGDLIAAMRVGAGVRVVNTVTGAESPVVAATALVS